MEKRKEDIFRPNGFLVMDTCCFVDYIEGNNVGLDYSRIKTFVMESSYWVVITPYTLYEIIQKLNSVPQIHKRLDDLMAIGDFWVINMNDLLEYDGFEYGLDFLFSLHMTRDEDLLEYDRARFQLREKVYHSLYKKMFFFAQLVAVACVVFEECDESGVIPSDAVLQMKMIDVFFEGKKNYFEWTFDRFFAQSDGKDFICEDGLLHKGHDAKEILNEQLWDLLIQILSNTRVRREIVTNNEVVDDNDFNRRLVEQYYYYLNNKYQDKKHCLSRLLKDCRNKTHGKVSIDSIIQLAFNKSQFDINMLEYRRLLAIWFSNNGVGKHFCNHFIDMTNVAMAETLKQDNVIVLTSDKEWQSIILKSDCKNKALNRSFYSCYSI